MGLTHVVAMVRKPGRNRPSARLRLLVDSGATYSVLPEPVWKKLRLRAARSVEFDLADGTVITRSIAEATFSLGGRTATSPIVLGGPGDVALLGAVTLETLGLILNPLTRELMELRMMLTQMRA